jgi:hypothetical protein
MLRWFGSLVVFALVLVALKVFFGWPISIGGSLVLTIILSDVLALFIRTRRRSAPRASTCSGSFR